MHSSAFHMPSNFGLRVVNVFDMHMDPPLETGITYEDEFKHVWMQMSCNRCILRRRYCL